MAETQCRHHKTMTRFPRSARNSIRANATFTLLPRLCRFVSLFFLIIIARIVLYYSIYIQRIQISADMMKLFYHESLERKRLGRPDVQVHYCSLQQALEVKRIVELS